MEVREILSKRLKWLREQKRLAQKEVAAEIGMTLNGYQKIEYGNREPKLDVLVGLAKLYNVRTDFLLGISDFTEHIKKLFFKAHEERVRMRQEEISANYIISEIQQKREEMLQSSEKFGITDERTIRKSVNLDNLLNERKNNEYKLFQVRKEYGQSIYVYITELMKIPHSNPSEDDLIKDLQPFRIEIQKTLFEEYSLSITCSDGFLGNYENYPTEEEAREAKIKLLKILNGVLKLTDF